MLVGYKVRDGYICLQCAHSADSNILKQNPGREAVFESEISDGKVKCKCCGKRLCKNTETAIKAAKTVAKTAEVAIVKRGRGRPRKNSVVVEVVKRGRGRPRKNPT